MLYIIYILYYIYLLSHAKDLPYSSHIRQALEDGRDFDPAELEELITLVEVR